MSVMFFFPFLFYFLLRFAVKIMRKSRDKDESDSFFRFHARFRATMQNRIHIKWSISVYGQTLPSLIKNILCNLNVRKNYCVNESNAFFRIAQRNKNLFQFRKTFFFSKEDKKP